MEHKLSKNIVGATKTKKAQYSAAINSLQRLRKNNIKLILGHGEISAVNPFFKVPKNKMVVMFVKVGCELGDTSSAIFWNAIATDPDQAYVQKVLLTDERAMPNDFLFKYKLIYPAGSFCPNVFTTLGCYSGMKSGIYDEKQIRSMKYENLPCVIDGDNIKVTTEEMIQNSSPKEKEIYVSYTCLFLRSAENPFEDVWATENIPKEQVKAILDCSYNFSKHAEQLFHRKYKLFPIRYTPPGVIDKPGVVLREYDKKRYHDLRIFKIFDSKGSNFWEKMSYYTGLKYVKENISYTKYAKNYNSICGKILHDEK